MEIVVLVPVPFLFRLLTTIPCGLARDRFCRSNVMTIEPLRNESVPVRLECLLVPANSMSVIWNPLETDVVALPDRRLTTLLLKPTLLLLCELVSMFVLVRVPRGLGGFLSGTSSYVLKCNDAYVRACVSAACRNL